MGSDEPVQNTSAASTDETEEPAVDAASEPADTNSVFGTHAQPQGIYDEKIVGNTDPLSPGNDEPLAAQYDPEKDSRMTGAPQE